MTEQTSDRRSQAVAAGAVALGGAAGTLLRWGVVTALNPELTGSSWPVGTLSANLAGALLLGALVGRIESGSLPRWVVLALGTGLLGSFTTFSSFAVEGVLLLDRSGPALSATYVAVSVLLGYVLTAWGHAIGRRSHGGEA